MRPLLHTSRCPQLPLRAGPVLITHFTLLLGMAVPVWLSNALLPDTLGATAAQGAATAAGLQAQRSTVWLEGYAGVMILGERGRAGWQLVRGGLCLAIHRPGRQPSLPGPLALSPTNPPTQPLSHQLGASPRRPFRNSEP